MELEERIAKIEERNKAVELDKAWETSWARRLLLTLLIYFAISIFIKTIGVPNPWLSGLVPAVAFLISTLTMPWFKKLWLKNHL
jgi:hypothetical protein